MNFIDFFIKFILNLSIFDFIVLRIKFNYSFKIKIFQIIFINFKMILI